MPFITRRMSKAQAKQGMESEYGPYPVLQLPSAFYEKLPLPKCYQSHTIAPIQVRAERITLYIEYRANRQ